MCGQMSDGCEGGSCSEKANSCRTGKRNGKTERNGKKTEE